MTPWTYDEFDARVDEYRDALSRRDRSLIVRLALTIGSMFLALAVLPRPAKAHADRWLVTLGVGLAAFAVSVLATSRGYSRRHAVRCPACDAALTAVADWLADAREFGMELPSHVGCPRCHAVIIAPAT
jgi:hypothetical protein